MTLQLMQIKDARRWTVLAPHKTPSMCPHSNLRAGPMAVLMPREAEAFERAVATLRAYARVRAWRRVAWRMSDDISQRNTKLIRAGSEGGYHDNAARAGAIASARKDIAP